MGSKAPKVWSGVNESGVSYPIYDTWKLNEQIESVFYNCANENTKRRDLLETDIGKLHSENIS